ncbi:MAG: hypothetical protein MJZ89_00970 [Paludibacteraceae bacterium]|nr:hypothetical protein [Paludibacteraceae bacterium]
MADDLNLGLEFDDDECIQFILQLIPEEDRDGMTEDDIQYVLDAIYDYYESEGLIDEDEATDGYIDETAELNYIQAACRKDGIRLTDEQIQLILDAEFQYGLEKGFYEDDDEE